MTWRVVLLAAAGLGFAVALLVLLGTIRWSRASARLQRRLDAGRRPSGPPVFEPRELDGAPAPVRRWLRAALTPGQRIVAAAHVRHAGTMELGEGAGRWRPFTSEELLVPARPGFHWDARFPMPAGASVHVRDAYVAGEGILQAAILGLVPVMDLRGEHEHARGELMRFLAEAVWLPTALLPGRGVRWEAVDGRSALATLADGDVSVTLRFRFSGDGSVETVEADARARIEPGKVVHLPWRGRFWDYKSRDGMRIPLEGEVSWVTPEGERAYWRGRITDIRYEFR